jgi:predicted porin
MKIRTLNVAASLLAAGLVTSAHAQSVQVYGIIGAYIGSVKRSGDAAAIRQLGGGGLNTSFLGFRGEEDLGGGTKALFVLESFFRPDTGEQGRNATDPFWSRNAWVGIEGRIGRLSFGRHTNPTYGVMSQLSPFGTSVMFSPLVLHTFVAAYGSNIVGDTVWNNTVQYATPEHGGFRAVALYGLGEVADKSGIANTGLHATYKREGLFVAVSAQRVRVTATGPLAAEQKSWMAGATYDFGLLKAHLNTIHTDVDRGRTSRLYDAGLTIPLTGVSAILLEAARTHSEAPGVANGRRTTGSAGYDYRLSKRTDVYAIYSRDKRRDAAGAGTMASGLRHLF